MSSTDQDEGISTSNIEDAVDIPSSASQLDFRKDDKNPSKIPSETNISLEGTGDCVRPTKSDNDEPKQGSNNTSKEDATDITMGNLGAYGSITKSGLEGSTIQHSDKLDQTNIDKSDQTNTGKSDQTTTCKSDQPNTDKSDQTDSDKDIIINDDSNPQMLTDKILECKTVTSPTADTSSDIQDELVLKWYDTESDEMSVKSKTNDDTLSITSIKGDKNNESIETDEESIDKDLLKAIDTQISQLDEEITNSPDKTVSDEIINEKLPLENTEKDKDSTNDQVIKANDKEMSAIVDEIPSDMAKNVDKPIIDDNIATSSKVLDVLVPPSLTTTEIDKTSMESDVLESSDADIVLKCVAEHDKAEERDQESFKTSNDDIHVDPTKLDKNDDAKLINTDVITASGAEISQLDEKLANSPHKTTTETFITTSSKEFDDKVPPSLEKTEIDKTSIKDHVIKAIDEEIATIDADLPSDTVKDVGTAIADENIATSTKVLNEVLPTSPAKTESDKKLKESAIPKVKHPETSGIDEELSHSVAKDIEKTELGNSITKKDILKTIDAEILKLDSDLPSSPDKSMNKTMDEDIVTSDNKLLEEIEPPSVAQTKLDKSTVKNDILEVTDAKSQLDEEHNSSGDKVQFADEPIASTSKVLDEIVLPKLEKDINPAKDIVEVIDVQISQLDEHTAVKANISDKIDESFVTEESMADTSDEVPEVTDSLGLLAESSRVIDQDDEEQETSDHDDGDDEEDFDPDDESSNQMTAEHSEDSNAQHSESDVPRDKPNLPPHVEALDDAQDFIDNTPEIESPMEDRDEFNFAITNVVSETAVGDIQDVSVDVEDDICNEIEDTLDTADDDNIEDVDITIEESTIEIEGTTIVAEDITIVAEDTTIEPKDTTIEAKDSAFKVKVTTIDAKDSVVKAKDSVVKGKDSVVKGKDSVVKGKDSVVKGKDSVVKGKDTMIEAKDTAIEAKDTTVKAKDITIEIKDTSLETKETAVAKTIPDTETDLMDESLSDADTVKLSDTSDTEETAGTYESHKLRKLLSKMSEENEEKQSPSKQNKLEIAKPNNVVSIVDLEESSSEDDIQEVAKTPDEVSDDVTNVNISGQIEIMSSGGNTSDITTKKGEIVISGVPKPPPMKPARLNTSEVTIKTKRSEPVIVYPPAKIKNLETKDKLKHMSLEVFNLDSDEEGSIPDDKEKPNDKLPHNKCVNSQCTSDNSVAYYAANPSSVAYYDPGRKKRAMICAVCADKLDARAQRLIEGIRNLTPLLSLEMGSIRQELVEISDSDSDDDTDSRDGEKDTIGVEGASVVEEKLSRLLNETWLKYKLDDRLKEAHDELAADMERLEKESKEVDTMLTECQVATDKLRHELYTSFEREGQQMPPIVVFDTPDNVFTCTEADQLANLVTEAKASKRRLSSPSASETASKRAAIPLGYAPLDNETIQPKTTSAEEKDVKPLVPAPVPFISDAAKVDDDKDISVVNLSAEAAPADLPPPGDITRPPLRVGMQIYAMRNAFGSWLRGKVVECTPKGSGAASQFTLCRVRFENKTNKSAFKLLPARSLAYSEPAEVRMTIGTRLIALFKDTMQPARRESFYSGVVSEVPNPVNSYRYLVFFDDGYAQYVHHKDTRLVCEFSPLVWEEVHPFSRDFVREYLLAYPERPMVRLHTGQSLKTEWNGKWWLSRVVQVDASLVHVHFQEDNRTEWIYRGSTRLAPLYLELQAAERHRARPLPRNRIQNKVNMPYVEYTRSDELPPVKPATQPQTHTQAQAQAQTHAQSQQEEFRRQRSVAKKSTGASQPPPPAPAPHAPRPLPMPVGPVDSVQSRVVYYTPKNAVRPYKMVPHSCSPRCKRSDVLALNDLRTYNPLAKPLLSGWERQIVRVKSLKQVMYRAPCGRRLRNMRELHRYLRAVHSDMGVDLFDFGPTTNCLAEFVLNKCIIAKKDLSNGKENVPVPCVNYYDSSLPEFCSYNTERTPTEGVPLNLDPDFLCGCDCTDDCEDKSKCACWQMTLEGARTIGADSRRVGYVYKRLPEPLSSGIYECNSRCKCKSTCLNRVAQHPLQLKLQVFKTLNRGWGIRALNDVPKGAFLCVYAGNLLTDATANLDGLNEGDEYLAELDYIEVVEQMKEGYEEDIPNADKKLDQKQSGDDSSTEESSPSEDESTSSKSKKDDGDFEPGYTYRVTEFSKRLRKREKSKKEKEDGASGEKNKDSGKDKGEGDCITISDDEEVREPSRFMAQAGMGGNQFISKHKSVRSYFGEDEACYIMDAKVQGNIGRYLNHSCSPNVFVQNVFVDTHDPRFPWVAFFALWPIRAGTELTWNYNYDVGSVPGKVLYCYCGAVNCRGRLL